MKDISDILTKEIDRLDNLSAVINLDINNFEKNYDNEMQEMLSNAENFDVDNVSIPDSQKSKDINNLAMGTSQFLQGGKLEIGTYVGAFKAVSGSVGLLGKGLKKLFKTKSKIHISDIPSDKLNNALKSHKIKTSDNPYVLIDNGENGLNSVIYSKKGISVSNSNLNKNYFFNWDKIKKFDLQQREENIFVLFNNSDNVNLKFFYEGKQSKLGLLFYIAQSMKNLNEKPNELKKILPKVKTQLEKLKSAKSKLDNQEKISISEYTNEYEFKNLKSYLFYKISNEDLSNFVKINYYKFKEFLSKDNTLSIKKITKLLQREFNAEIFYQDVNSKTKEKIERKLSLIGSELSKYDKQKEFIKRIEKLDISKNPEIVKLLDEIKKEQFDKSLFTNTIQEIEQDREEYLEYKRKRTNKITWIVIVSIFILLALFVVIMNLTQN